LIVSISAVLLLGAFTVLLWRYAGLKAWHALVCVLLGFYLASSSVATVIDRAAKSLVEIISGQ
jgi:F0F1-type ATP synthase assembly protein I